MEFFYWFFRLGALQWKAFIEGSMKLTVELTLKALFTVD